MCEYAAVGKNWGLVVRFGNLFLDFNGEKHYLLELREKEWNYNSKPGCVDGLRCFYENANKRMLLKRLNEIGVSDDETRVRIIKEILGIARKLFVGRGV